MTDGFFGGLPLPDELKQAIRAAHDQQHMAADAEAARVDSFITGLDVDGLMALRAILNTGDMTKSASANFWDGQLVALLKFVKHVDPFSGEPDPLAQPDQLD
jgi:hypothetical protein